MGIEEKRFAMLIDSDNVSAKYIKDINEELAQYGNITYKRIYGDWTSQDKNSWRKVLLEYSITPIQQYSYTTGKNSTDSAMIIDAMDILYSGNVEGFCIVSSDSDFTRLSIRLRESGMQVVGMGEKKTPKPFIDSCNEFKYLEVLAGKEMIVATDKTQIENTIVKIIIDNGFENTGINTGDLKNRLIKQYPDLSYGGKKFSKFLASLNALKVENQGTVVRLTQSSIVLAEKMVIDNIPKDKGILMSELNAKLRAENPDFSYKNFGYNRFIKFLRAIDGIRIDKVTQEVTRE